MKQVIFTRTTSQYDWTGCPVYYSKCKKYRILFVGGTNKPWYTHYKRKGVWYGMPGLPFASKYLAIKACRIHKNAKTE